jgi:hypothetical protein
VTHHGAHLARRPRIRGRVRIYNDAEEFEDGDDAMEFMEFLLGAPEEGGNARAIELLTVPTPAGLSPAAGTIEVDVEISDMARRQVTGQNPQIFNVLRADDGNGIWLERGQSDPVMMQAI